LQKTDSCFYKSCHNSKSVSGCALVDFRSAGINCHS
jgi:hypothetical protein